MKKLVWISLIVFVASACTTYTCPTYSQVDTEIDNSEESIEKVDKA